MFKKSLILLLMGILPVFAGDVEKALDAGNSVLLYLHTPICGYCKKFDPLYDKLAKKYANKHTFVKVDASSKYGRELMYKYRGMYVPYVLIINNDKAGVIPTQCLMDKTCAEHAIEQF